jgi:hypothetical protein
VSRSPQSSYDHRWYAAALKQIAEARWKNERLTVISGPAGAGKTTLCRQVADRKGTRTLAVLLASPPPTANAFLRALALEIGALSKTADATTPIGSDELRQPVHEFFTSIVSLGADCLVIVDDAHRLQPDAMDEVHALLASTSGRRSSLQFVLVGQFDAAIDRPAPLPPVQRERPVRPPRPVPLADGPYAPTVAPQRVTVPPPVVVPEPAAETRSTFERLTRGRGAGIVGSAAAIAGLMVWYGAAHRRTPPPVVTAPTLTEAAAARTRAAEAALAAIVAEIDGPAATTPQERSVGSTGAIAPTGPGWADEMARRAVALARRPDLPGLIALRSAVAALRTTTAEEGRQVESVLRRLDESLADARRRQLAIDHRQIVGAGSTNNR